MKITSFVCPNLCRIILKKGKSIRQVMKERGVLDTFLKNHPKVDPGAKYLYNNDAVAYEPFTNYLDVSEGEVVSITLGYEPFLDIYLDFSSFDFGLFTKPKSHLPMESVWISNELEPLNTTVFPFPPSFFPLLAHSLKLPLYDYEIHSDHIEVN